MSDVDPLASLKRQALEKWDWSDPNDRSSPIGEVSFESERAPHRARGGLELGHSVHPKTGERRLELRVTAEAGPNFERAKAVQRFAAKEGVESLLRVSAKPNVSDLPRGEPKVFGRRRPLHIGASIAHHQAAAGTLGAFVRLRDGRTGVVSCGHVLARLNSALKLKKKKMWGDRADPIHQPGWPDEDPVVLGSRVGALEDFSPFVGTRGTNLDAAVAVLDVSAEHMGNVIPDVPCVPPNLRGRELGSTIATSELVRDMRVVKIGRTTGLTEGTLEAVHFVNVRVNFEGESVAFFELHEVRWDEGWENDESKRYAANGDSGSLVLLKDGLRPIGLHFATAQRAGYRASYVVAWPKIAAAFGLNLL
jgi:hypothetical protein